MILFILLFSLASCQKGTVEKTFLVEEGTQNRPIGTVVDDPRGGNEIESEFIDYVTKFEGLHPNPNFQVTTPIYFQDIEDENVLGVCITWTNDDLILKEIQVDQPNFDAALADDPMVPEIIVFHELGHCELALPHDPTLTLFAGTLIPFNIMFPSLFSDRSVYTQHNAHYMDVLFGGDGTLIPIGSRDSFSEPISLGMKNGYEGSAVYLRTH
jgi:hypothetical protein